MASEATWTAPRLDCPHPEHWSAPDSRSTEDQVAQLLEALVAALQPELVLETGSHVGHTTARMGQQLQRNGHGRLVSLEYDAGPAAEAARRCQGLPVQVVPVDSVQYLRHYRQQARPQPIQLAFLDTEFDTRAAELWELWGVLDTGAVVVVHDTGPHYPCWDNITAVPGYRWLRLPTPRGVALGQAE